MTSRHYEKDRKYRENTIKQIFGNEGEVIFEIVKYDEKRKKEYLYQITENAILIVKAVDCDLIITKMMARPSRIKKYWEDAPKKIIEIAIANARDPRRFA